MYYIHRDDYPMATARKLYQISPLGSDSVLRNAEGMGIMADKLTFCIVFYQFSDIFHIPTTYISLSYHAPILQCASRCNDALFL